MNRSEGMALLVAAVDQGSLSGASRVSGISLASVSRRISALEERVGTRLLVRSTRALRLTEAGQRYYAEAKRLLAEMDELESSMRIDAAEPSGRLRVTAPTLYGRVHLQPLLAKFLVQHPKVALDLHLLDRPVNLLEEGIDLAVLVGEQPSSSLVARRLGSIRWVLSAGVSNWTWRDVSCSSASGNQNASATSACSSVSGASPSCTSYTCALITRFVCTRGLPSTSPRWPRCVEPVSESPTSSTVSRSAAARGWASASSRRPPGNAMCPDHGSPARRARSMKSTSGP